MEKIERRLQSAIERHNINKIIKNIRGKEELRSDKRTKINRSKPKRQSSWLMLYSSDILYAA